MALIPVCRVGDTASGFCTNHKSGQNWTGQIDTVDSSVQFTDNGIQIATVDATGWTSCGHRFQIISSTSITSSPNGKKIARLGDPVIVLSPGFGTGTLTSGSLLVKSE